MRKLTALLLLLTFLPSQLFAWSSKGHRVVADIASNHLSSVAKQRLQVLLGNGDLATISTWADEVRPDRPETAGWHFVDIPKTATGFSDQRDCYRPNESHPSSINDHQNCVVDRIAFFARVLGDPKAPAPDRLEGLKFLVHFVGDIHQPLHAMEEGRGGNDVHVVEFGSAQCGSHACNLHHEWDTGLIEHTDAPSRNTLLILSR